jgi:hypothetical protein
LPKRFNQCRNSKGCNGLTCKCTVLDRSYNRYCWNGRRRFHWLLEQPLDVTDLSLRNRGKTIMLDIKYSFGFDWKFNSDFIRFLSRNTYSLRASFPKFENWM